TPERPGVIAIARVQGRLRARGLLRLGRRRLDRLAPAQPLRHLADPQDPRGDPADDRVRGHVPVDDGVGADHRVVADANPAQEARAVADPDVRPDDDVALVYPLHPDRPLDLDHAVVEVDEHRAVRDDALLAEPHPLVGGDRALLAEHGLGADLDHALVAADLRSIADPGEAPEAHRGAAPDLQLEAAPEENRPLGLPAPPSRREQPPPRIAPQKTRVLQVEHAIPREEAKRSD